ncbi:MAG: BMP family ABC transporter substrate-binding protein [Sphingomonadales bacterium]|nr:BMP family ABC transporter substrate-binding protein [Sphingomonadales bacterium]
MKRIIYVILALFLVASPQATMADEPKIALIYDLGGKFDKSFNEAAHNGGVAFESATGVSYHDFEPASEAQMEQAIKRFARRGYDLIIAIGISYATPLRKVAEDYPDMHFTVIDSHVDMPNVQSVSFKEHEGSYLVGMIAAMTSEKQKIGFIGGMDIPLIRKFASGYAQGARSINPDIEIIENMVGASPTAWNDPIRGGELARNQYARGADVIYSAAGPTGFGVIQAAKETDNYAIGVDSNQNHLAPGYVLTSMLKRVDRAVERAMLGAYNGNWHSGVEVLGLAEDGVDYALDEHNEHLITDEMRQRLAEARAKIISGEIVVNP